MKPVWRLWTARFGCLLAVSSLTAPAFGATSSWIRNPQSAVRLVTPYAAAPRSGDARIGVEFQLAPGWHAYWRNPGSAGFPPAFTSQTPGWRILETRWPAPSRFDLPGGLVAYGYQDEVVYPLRSHLTATGDSLRLVVDVDYLVCEIECVPYRYDLVLDQKLADTGSSDPEGEATVAPWERRVPTPAAMVPGLVASGSLDWRDETHGDLRLSFAGLEGEPDLYLELHEALDFGAPEKQPGGLTFVVPAVRKNAGRPLPHASDVAWTLTGLTGGGPRNVEGFTSVALVGARRLDWRWILAAAVLAAILIALFTARRPPAG